MRAALLDGKASFFVGTLITGSSAGLPLWAKPL